MFAVALQEPIVGRCGRRPDDLHGPATGRIIFDRERRKRGRTSASPVAAQMGGIFLCSSRGTVSVIEAADTSAEHHPPDQSGRADSRHPALAGSRLFIRSGEYLYAFGE